MGYYNYHAKIKKLIQENHLVSVEIVDNWNGIKPAMVLYFDNNKPMPIREYRWCEYDGLLILKTENSSELPNNQTKNIFYLRFSANNKSTISP